MKGSENQIALPMRTLFYRYGRSVLSERFERLLVQLHVLDESLEATHVLLDNVIPWNPGSRPVAAQTPTKTENKSEHERQPKQIPGQPRCAKCK